VFPRLTVGGSYRNLLQIMIGEIGGNAEEECAVSVAASPAEMADALMMIYKP
jgi:hypothetical protein